ncbi:MAG TPA: DUF2800 domain-containing protein [Clostridiales bacterium]|nr:DUF2800 domain-containing protein [Clostridiales bacterium]
MTAERPHALLSASAAHRWLACPPSARLEEKLPELQSSYAAEGTLAHAIAELKARRAFLGLSEQEYKAKLQELQSDPLYEPEMLTHTDIYIDYITSIANGYPSLPHIATELRLDYSEWVPEGYGTGDCVILWGNTLHVIDFKYGKGVPVEAEENPQIMLYALGAYSAYKMIAAIDTVKMAIIQPRLRKEPSEWEISINDLLAWGENIRPIARKAYEGRGEFNPGDHCKFCRARFTCRARAASYLSLEDDYAYGRPLEMQDEYPDAPLLTREQIGAAIQRAEGLLEWVEDLKRWALAECLAGRPVPGWKAVEGRSVRQLSDPDAAYKALAANGYDINLFYERKPIALTAAEKIVGKTQFEAICADYIIKPPGKPTLVPETDKRPAVTNVQSAAEVFGDIIETE